MQEPIPSSVREKEEVARSLRDPEKPFKEWEKMPLFWIFRHLS